MPLVDTAAHLFLALLSSVEHLLYPFLVLLLLRRLLLLILLLLLLLLLLLFLLLLFLLLVAVLVLLAFTVPLWQLMLAEHQVVAGFVVVRIVA